MKAGSQFATTRRVWAALSAAQYTLWTYPEIGHAARVSAVEAQTAVDALVDAGYIRRRRLSANRVLLRMVVPLLTIGKARV